MKPRKLMYIEDHHGDLDLVMRIERREKTIRFLTLDTEEQQVKLKIGGCLYFDTEQEAIGVMENILEKGL